jgi:hypothetical protein
MDRRNAFRECPMCAEPVRARAKICRYCGHTFTADDPYVEFLPSAGEVEPLPSAGAQVARLAAAAPYSWSALGTLTKVALLGTSALPDPRQTAEALQTVKPGADGTQWRPPVGWYWKHSGERYWWAGERLGWQKEHPPKRGEDSSNLKTATLEELVANATSIMRTVLEETRAADGQAVSDEWRVFMASELARMASYYDEAVMRRGVSHVEFHALVLDPERELESLRISGDRSLYDEALRAKLMLGDKFVLDDFLRQRDAIEHAPNRRRA